MRLVGLFYASTSGGVLCLVALVQLCNLIVLLSSGSVKQIEPRRNGLGLNNILYIAILVEHFRKRVALGKSAGELILIEEPEAHLHPQLQNTLVDALRSMPFQSILTTQRPLGRHQWPSFRSKDSTIQAPSGPLALPSHQMVTRW